MADWHVRLAHLTRENERLERENSALKAVEEAMSIMLNTLWIALRRARNGDDAASEEK